MRDREHGIRSDQDMRAGRAWMGARATLLRARTAGERERVSWPMPLRVCGAGDRLRVNSRRVGVGAFNKSPGLRDLDIE